MVGSDEYSVSVCDSKGNSCFRLNGILDSHGEGILETLRDSDNIKGLYLVRSENGVDFYRGTC